MDVSCSPGPGGEEEVLVWPVFSDEPQGPGEALPGLGPSIEAAIRSGHFSGAVGERHPAFLTGERPRQVLLAGVGRRKAFGPKALEGAAGAAGHALSERTETVSLALEGVGPLSSELVEAAVTGFHQGAYRFERYRTAKKLRLKSLRLKGAGGFGPAAEKGRIVGESVGVCRDLVNVAPADKTPEALAETVRELGATHGFSVKVIGRRALEQMGAGGIMAVGGGSANPPVAIFMEYGEGGDGPPLGLLGKGVTFDAGGLSLKTPAGMETMKGDMAGAGAVIGAMCAISRLRPRVHVIGLAMVAENLPGAGAMKPGDVLSMLDGTTVEVLNTDAEGRLLLADGITMLRKRGASAICDLATLTGAQVTALGHLRAGLVGNDEALLAAIEAAALGAGEGVWRMPADGEYLEAMRSDVADFKNTGGRAAGMLTAALLVGAFAGPTPWAHLDIAGPAFEIRSGASMAPGGTGFGTKTLIRWVEGASRAS